MKLEFAYRDEAVNIFSMTKGFGDLYQNYQKILCKKEKIEHIGPFILDPKKSRTIFKLSQKGTAIEKITMSAEYKLEFVAFIDTYLKIKIE